MEDTKFMNLNFSFKNYLSRKPWNFYQWLLVDTEIYNVENWSNTHKTLKEIYKNRA